MLWQIRVEAAHRECCAGSRYAAKANQARNYKGNISSHRFHPLSKVTQALAPLQRIALEIRNYTVDDAAVEVHMRTPLLVGVLQAFKTIPNNTPMQASLS
jgi:hypothetical protein